MKTETTTLKSKALFSDDGEHRLLLRKEWDKNKKSAMVVMLHPTNAADSICMDLTTTLVINNLADLGFGSVSIVNLYSRIMKKLSLRFNSDEDLIANETDAVIEQHCALSDAVIIAWGVGNTTQRIRERQAELLKRLAVHKNKLYQIGKEGYHPLTPAIRSGWELEPYNLEVNENAENNES